MTKLFALAIIILFTVFASYLLYGLAKMQALRDIGWYRDTQHKNTEPESVSDKSI